MCTAGQRVSLTITGPGPSFLSFFLFFSLCVSFSLSILPFSISVSSRASVSLCELSIQKFLILIVLTLKVAVYWAVARLAVSQASSCLCVALCFLCVPPSCLLGPFNLKVGECRRIFEHTAEFISSNSESECHFPTFGKKTNFSKF